MVYPKFAVNGPIHIKFTGFYITYLSHNGDNYILLSMRNHIDRLKSIIFMMFLSGLLFSSCQDSSPGRPPVAFIEPIEADLSGDKSAHTASQLFRDKDLTQNEAILSYKQEAQALPAHYRKIPSIAIDHDQGQTKITRPAISCGQSGSIAERIADCLNKNPQDSIASAKNYGNAGEATWRLVSKTQNGANSGFEIWIDSRTQKIWSDNIGNTNWCRASGNAEDIGGVDCQGLGSGQAWCEDDQISIEEKGNLTGLIDWRLPTRADYLQADLDGIRQIFKSQTNAFWSATALETNLSQAWTFNIDTGVFTAQERSNGSVDIRCIGSIK